MSRAAPNTDCVPAHRVAPVDRSIMTSTKSRGKAVFVLPSKKRHFLKAEVIVVLLALKAWQ